jgi:Rieske 2Fe-2S family protein
MRLPANTPNLSDLLAAQRPGHSLTQPFYNDPAIFERDMAWLYDRWCCAGHISELPAAGDFITAELGREGAIIVRGQDGVVRALANVCRHRGSRICTARHGHAPVLTCPYHAWAYQLDGRLRHAREMPQDFDPALHGLHSLPIAVIGGLIFISFGEHPPSLESAQQPLGGMTARFGWGAARIAARKTYGVRANWKLVLENYHECYHCGPAHPEFAQHHVLARPGARRIGPDDHEAWGAMPDGQEVFRVMHSALAAASATGSRDGAPVAPPMGDAGYDGIAVFAELGFLSAFLAYPDYGVIYRFLPISVSETAMELLWLVRGDAEPDRDALTWLWDITSLADKAIIERNQLGVNSRFYRPGPFSTMEPGARQFVDRYVKEIIGTCHARPSPAKSRIA